MPPADERPEIAINQSRQYDDGGTGRSHSERERERESVDSDKCRRVRPTGFDTQVDPQRRPHDEQRIEMRRSRSLEVWARHDAVIFRTRFSLSLVFTRVHLPERRCPSLRDRIPKTSQTADSKRLGAGQYHQSGQLSSAETESRRVERIRRESNSRGGPDSQTAPWQVRSRQKTERRQQQQQR